MKRPSFQFYPGDWLRATELRACSVGARGLWIDMICLMHEGNPYGYLKVGGKVIHPTNLARMVGATLFETEGWLKELEEAAVFSVDAEVCIFSRRMVRDEELRVLRASGGKLGGNPALMKDKPKVDNVVNLHTNLQPTPASASSSAKQKQKPVAQLPAWLPLDTWVAFLDMRKKIKKPLGDYGQHRILLKLEKMRAGGDDVLARIDESIMKCWQDVYPDAALKPAQQSAGVVL